MASGTSGERSRTAPRIELQLELDRRQTVAHGIGDDFGDDEFDVGGDPLREAVFVRQTARIAASLPGR
jgi:hypothetical protein